MAWLNEEERALGKGKFAPYSDFRMGVREANAVPRDFPKKQPETKQFDRIMESGQRFVDVYEKAQLSQTQALAKQQDDALTNDYAARLSDLRMQLSSGAISPQAFGMRERELYVKFVRSGADATKLNTLRTGLGGNIIQKSQDAYAVAEAKANVEHESEMVKAFQKENPAFQNVDRDTALAYIREGEQVQRAVIDIAQKINDPNITPEAKAIYEKEQEGNVYRLIAFKAINSVKNIAAQYSLNDKKAVVMTPAIADEMENAAVADLVDKGVEERAARYYVKLVQQPFRSFANANFGAITDFNKVNEAMIKTLEQNDTRLAYSVTPTAMFISKFGQSAQTFSGVLPKTEIEAELSRMATMKAASTDAFKAVETNKTPDAYKNSEDAQGAVNMMVDAVYNGLTVVTPDLGAAVVSIGARNFNEINYRLSEGGASSLTKQELEIAKENAEKLGAAIEQGGVNSQASANQALKDQCASDVMCFVAGKKVVEELGTGSEFAQAVQFLKNSVVKGDLRLTSDGQLVLTKPAFFSLSNIGTTFYKNQYLSNLETINKGLMNEPNINARKMIAMALYGTDLKGVGLSPITEPGGIKGLTSGAVEGVGKLMSGLSKLEQPVPDEVTEALQERKNVAEGNRNFLSIFEGQTAPQEEVEDRTYTNPLTHFRGELMSRKTFKSSFSKTYNMSFPSVQMTDENAEIIDTIKNAFTSLKANERYLDELKGYSGDWSDERERLLEENKGYDKIIRDGLKQITSEREQSSSNVKITPEHSTMVDKYSDEFGVDSDIVKRMLFKESSGDRKAVSPAGAKGLMQIMPRTFEDIKRELKLPKDADIFDPEINVRAGCYYFAKMMKQFGQDVNKALAAYNWGPGNVSEAVREYGENWFEGARDLGITVKDPKTGKNVKRYLPKETQKYVSDLGEMYA